MGIIKNMVKVQISEDSAYPFYKITDIENPQRAIEIPDHVLKRWERVMEEFEEVQREMLEYYYTKRK